ncbi:MAG TPA: YbbC/YhhH family protein [Blastocatellia bacterium]|nr:YbbC/YhhH family protein [Blastocatellia bacterium]
MPIYFKHILLAVAIALSLTLEIVPGRQSEDVENYKPKAGYVPDKETAIRIAEAVCIPIYGEDKVQREKPFVASLSNGVWYVHGSMPRPHHSGMKGGVAMIEISKDDGRILCVIHGK